MDPSAVAGLCALLARGGALTAASADPSCAPPKVVQTAVAEPIAVALEARIEAPGAREGIARVAFAEAGNQGDSGLAGVVYTILNRLQDGRWGAAVDQVLNARGQFEPVSRVGGDWRALPRVSAAGQARIDTILNLALEGRLPDLTRGARFFQNPAIVARRARAGTVSAELVNFGGQSASVIIGAHSFYVGAGRGGGGAPRTRGVASHGPAPGLFVGENRAAGPPQGSNTAAPPTPVATSEAPVGDPSQALFVSREGRVRGSPD